MIAILASSVIRDIDYDASRRELTVRLTSGKVYVYRRVPPEAFAAFASARSKGEHFNRHIRDRYFYSEPDEVGPPPAPSFAALLPRGPESAA